MQKTVAARSRGPACRDLNYAASPGAQEERGRVVAGDFVMSVRGGNAKLGLVSAGCVGGGAGSFGFGAGAGASGLSLLAVPPLAVFCVREQPAGPWRATSGRPRRHEIRPAVEGKGGSAFRCSEDPA